MNQQYNSGTRQHVREAEKQVIIDRTLDRDVVVALMSNPNGRRWMHNKLAVCYVFATTHTGNALQTAFLEGNRNVGLMFLADIMAYCPDDYITMMREHAERERAAEARRKDPRATVTSGESGDGEEGPADGQVERQD